MILYMFFLFLCIFLPLYVGSSPATPTMRSVLIGFEYPCGTLRIIFAQNPIRRPAPGSS